MFVTKLSTSNRAVELVEPEVERDSALGVRWMAGSQGRETLKLMGVAAEHNRPSTLEQERRRVIEFLSGPDQFNWMISWQGRVVGTIWVDRRDTGHIKAPAISIMLGDPSVRGHGIGSAAVQAVIEFLHSRGETSLRSRHLLENHASAKLMHGLGFTADGPQYTDPEDGLSWQNLVLETSA
jgi:RimJ/RimL family protein N-acetyltransferase